MAKLESELFNYKSHYENDGVLINDFNITDKSELDKKERTNTTARLALLYLKPSLALKDNMRKFSLEHYLNIHKFLFDGIYPFAGIIRDEPIQKEIPFCLPQLIYNNLNDTLNRMDKNSNRITNRDELLDFITYYFAEVDVIHPFREGNGRCEREFFRQYVIDLCEKNNLDNYYLDFSLIDNKDDFINAVVDADACIDSEHLRNIFDNILVSEEKKLRR